MVPPGVIAGLAVIDASVIGQAMYALRSYEKKHPQGSAAAEDRGAAARAEERDGA
jgi:hypothetical protein